MLGNAFHRSRRARFVRKLQSVRSGDEALAAVREEFALDEESLDVPPAESARFYEALLAIALHAIPRRRAVFGSDFGAANDSWYVADVVFFQGECSLDCFVYPLSSGTVRACGRAARGRRAAHQGSATDRRRASTVEAQRTSNPVNPSRLCSSTRLRSGV